MNGQVERRIQSPAVNVLYLRVVELVAFALIFLVARLIADFTYPTGAMVALFAAAGALHYGGEMFWTAVARRRDWNAERRYQSLTWYSSYVDLAAVIGLLYLTGTVESPFVFMLVVPLFFACHVFSWKTTVVSYLLPALGAMTLLSTLELAHVIPHFNCYQFEPGVYENPHYVAGSLMVLGAFASLVLFLANAFQDNIQVSLERLRRKGEESELRLSELSRLYDISTGINAAISIDTLLKIVAREVTLLLERPWASIVLFNQKQEVTNSVFVGLEGTETIRIDRKMRRGGLSEWIWTHSAPIVVENTARDKRANCSEFMSNLGIRSIVGVPLTASNQVIGIVFTGDFKPRATTEAQMRLLNTLCTQLSVAIEKSRLYESLERKIRSQERQIQALEKSNILKSDFVTHVSHELRTPLTSIKAYVETLTEHFDSPGFTQREEFLGIVSKETNRLIRIVDDILDVSKIEFGQRPVERASVELKPMVQDVVSMMSPALDRHHVSIEIDVPDSLPRVDADEDLMKQVLINLISNAVKYSPAGTSVTVSARQEAVDIVVTVEDQGIGIAADEVEHVFDKYFRARAQNGTRFEGVGLGLAIVKNIVEQHGGQIHVESTEGVGSRFSFSIPREHCFNDLIGYISEVVDAREQLQEMLELIVRMIAELLSAKIVSLMLLDKTRSELFIKMSYGLDEWIVENTRVQVGEGIAGKVAETGEALFIPNIEHNDVFTARNNPQYETVSLLSVPLTVSGVTVGVINVNNKDSGQPFTHDDFNLLISFSERISRALERVRVVEDSQAFLEDTIEAFRRMLDSKSKTKLIEATMNLTVKTARKIGMSEKDVSVVQYVASVHDIGMTEVSDEVLNKALSLSTEEVNRIRQHPQRGAELIRPLEFVEQVSNIILYHHERVDGRGYPMGLRGDEIPLGARILAVVDAYQSMTSGRPYKSSMAPAAAVDELVENAGRQFDPDVVEAFVTVLREEGHVETRAESKQGVEAGAPPS